MSQFPPTTTPPPPGFNPGGMPYGAPQPQRSTSVAAVISLICGILGCVPFLTGFIAVICGIVGLRATGKPNVGGRGMAIAGLILGLIALVSWSGIAALGGVGWWQTRPARELAKQYVKDIGAGDVQAAQAASVSGTSTETIQTLIDSVKSLGQLLDVTVVPAGAAVQTGQKSQTTVVAVGQFANGQKSFVIIIVTENGVDKVESAVIK